MGDRIALWTAVFVLVSWLIAGCAPPAAPTFAPARPTPLPMEESAMPTSTPMRRVERLVGDAAVARASAVLAERLGLPRERIEVVSVTSDEMPLEDLGCPAAGEGAGKRSPAMIIGQEIILRVDDQEYVFHTDGRRLILCRIGEERMSEQVWPEGEASEGRSTSVEAQLVTMAVEDLAGRLGIDKSAIQVETVEAVEWPDTSLGCPEPGMMYAQVITPGYRILLKARGQIYEYHGSRSRVVYCPR